MAGDAGQAVDVGDPGVTRSSIRRRVARAPPRWLSLARMSARGRSTSRPRPPTATVGIWLAASMMACDMGIDPARTRSSTPRSMNDQVERFVEHPVDAAVTEQDVLAARVQGGRQAVEHVGEPGLAQVVQHHPYRVGPPLGEQPGRGVGPVAEFGHGAHDGLAAGRADLGRVAQDERDERLGTPAGRDRLQGGSSGRFALESPRAPLP